MNATFFYISSFYHVRLLIMLKVILILGVKKSLASERGMLDQGNCLKRKK